MVAPSVIITVEFHEMVMFCIAQFMNAREWWVPHLASLSLMDKYVVTALVGHSSYCEAVIINIIHETRDTHNNEGVLIEYCISLFIVVNAQSEPKP